MDENEEGYFESTDNINELKPSVYKSLQMLWADVTRIEHRFEFLMEKPSEEIINKRKEIEKEIADFIRKTESEFDLDDIKEVIYNEDGNDVFKEMIMMFDTGQGAIELESIMEVLVDAWNYFPHRLLDGKCPMQMIKENK